MGFKMWPLLSLIGLGRPTIVSLAISFLRTFFQSALTDRNDTIAPSPSTIDLKRSSVADSFGSCHCGWHIRGHETEAVESTTTMAEKSNGQGRKSDAELEQDLVAESRLVQAQEQGQEKAFVVNEEDVVLVGEDEGDGDEGEKYSPQEMMKRRWAHVSFSE
ncbi:MAG: hypothetical protein J3R72DRAFT_476435 [Linnemannia gamsii]|nr:MAG: hypothetical protein J3R72DRAFT_476435 [Linnemannia gamsii]